MKYTVKLSTQFKKDLKRIRRQGLPESEIQEVAERIANRERLPREYRDHPLTGNWKGHRECHIRDNWLLVYYKTESTLVLTLVRSGTHDEIFGR